MRQPPRHRLTRKDKVTLACELAHWPREELPEAWLWLRRASAAKRVFWVFDVDTLEWKQL